MDELEKKKNSLRNMKQYKNISDEELTNIAKERLEKDEILSNLTFCINEEEKKFATILLESYLTQGSFENFSEKQTLGQLIDQELLAKRMKEKLKTEYSTANPSIGLEMVDQLDKVIGRIEKLQEKLGLIRDQSNDSIFNLWEDLKTKCLKYYDEHAAEFQNRCPYCYKLFPSILPPEKLTPQVSSWFKGTDLYNLEVFELYHNKIITEEQAAKILGVSRFYIPYIYQEIYLKEKNDK